MAIQGERRSGRPGQIHLLCACGQDAVTIFPSPDRTDCPNRPEYSVCPRCGERMVQISKEQAWARHERGLRGFDPE